MTGADAIVRCLEKEGVEYVFGYPGVAIAPFYDSILDTDIKTVLVREEQNAAHAASGYARTSGKVGVAAVTSGPGATNLITGIATAFADSIPMVCITGQVNSHLMGSDVFQEADISGACESFVKYSYIIRNVQEIPEVLKEAFYIASTGRQGPVLIDIPIDVQKEEISRFRYPEEVKLRTYKPTVQGNKVQMDKLLKELKKAKRPILCIGGGVHLSHAEQEVREFVNRNQLPTVATMMGIGVMPTDDPYYFGMVGNNGRKYGNRVMNEADLILMVGARVADRSISQPSLITEGKVLVHIDVDPAEIGKNAGPTIPLVGDIRSIFTVLNKEAPAGDYTEWMEHLNEVRSEYLESIHHRLEQENPDYVSSFKFVRTLCRSLPDTAVYVADVGQNQLWSCAGYFMKKGKFFTSGGMGTMGYAIPAAVGAKLADPAREVVAVVGDGAFQMSMMELGTMRQYHVPVKICVFKNNVLGLVRQYQHLTYHDRFSVTDLSGSPELDKLAEAYGMKYRKLRSDQGMQEAIDAFLEKEESFLLEVDTDPDEVV